MYSPPYFLIMAALGSALAFGTAFSGVLGLFLKDKERKTDRLIAPYLGIVLSSVVFIGAGLQILGIYGTLPYLFALAFVVLLAAFVWFNLLREYT
ncbi:hypothetical protein [Anthocerotibacter panamensis]|uniref:hypothetical protein n=1 Tax=Anthocerotibacter panamensis TaxID=2857077 RepID=UPI001C408A68|nr:hypothetical protein [Anthocerotibacter panamensis]